MQQGEETPAKILGLYTPRTRPRWGTLTIVVLLHVLGFFALLRIFAPDFTAGAIESATSLITVTVRTVDSQEDEGAAAAEGAEAVPQEQSAPPTEVPVRPRPLPPAASTGTETRSGASTAGEGSGGGGDGFGTGSGQSGTGRGAVAAGPSVRSGELNQARDFPVPDGGRQVRFGKSVIVHFTVTTDGRARNCTVAHTQVDAATTTAVCPLVIEKIRFNPAVTADGTPVEARYGYRVDFRAR